jgi:serine O-acetyltransferase
VFRPLHWYRVLREDLTTILDRDPAARTKLEVVLCYPGLHAIWMHRVAHWFWVRHLKLVARLLSSWSRTLTGIEIHPAVHVGRRLFIDHGMALVIGETTEIGDDCTLYQGVTLGGTGKDVGKRHPTLRNRITVGAGARILGPVVIGDDSNIGASSVVLKDTPSGATVVGVPAQVVSIYGKKVSKVPALFKSLRNIPQLEGHLQQLRLHLSQLQEEELVATEPLNQELWSQGDGI